MGNYDSIDLDWSWDGDYILGDDGDVRDTGYDLLRSLVNELHTVARSEFGDWQEHPNVGSNLSDFRGEPNIREVGEAFRKRLVSRIVAAGLVLPEDISVRVVPIAKHQVAAIITIQATATSGNNISIGEPIVTTLVYDSLEDSVFFVEESRSARQFRTT